jgi:hypothetical protein
MSTDNMNEKQSLELIENMIKTAKQEHHVGGAFFFILWGCIVMLYSMLTFYAVQTHAEWQPWTYNLFLIGGIVSIIRSKRDDKVEQVKSWYDDLYMYVWSGAGICLGITAVFGPMLGLNNVLPVTMLIYGLANFITGGVTKYYPSLVGSIICFACVIIAFNLSFAYQNLLCAFAVLCTHLIPGLMMRKYYQRKGYAQ